MIAILMTLTEFIGSSAWMAIWRPDGRCLAYREALASSPAILARTRDSSGRVSGSVTEGFESIDPQAIAKQRSRTMVAILVVRPMSSEYTQIVTMVGQCVI